MGRVMYVHFGDDVPRKIEVEYNKLLRREQYLRERDAENGLIDIVDFDDVLELQPDCFKTAGPSPCFILPVHINGISSCMLFL